MSLVQKKVLGPLQNQFGTHKRWYDKVLGKAPENGLENEEKLFFNNFIYQKEIPYLQKLITV